MYKYIESLQGRISLFLGLIIVFFSLIENLSIYAILLEISGIYFLTRNIDCLIRGGCVLAAWLGLLIPTIAILLTLMYKISYFDTYKNKITSYLEYITKLNKSRCFIKKPYKINSIKVTHNIES
jgi:hypothetical protein